jgi:hypothetical protein
MVLSDQEESLIAVVRGLSLKEAGKVLIGRVNLPILENDAR